MKGLMNNALLVYAQDPGGAKFILPAIRKLLEGGEEQSDWLPASLMVHPFSRTIFRNTGVPFKDAESLTGSFPVTVPQWRMYLIKKGVQRVFCTTSAPVRDMSNSNLISAARELGVPSMGVMDHWKGFERFFHMGEMAFIPDQLCCIDECCIDRLVELGVPADRIHLVGHPYLEGILDGFPETAWDSNQARILLVSQPDRYSPEFRSVFACRTSSGVVIDGIAACREKISERTGKAVLIHYRPHPKEHPVGVLPSGIFMDDSLTWEDAVRNHDIFVGLDSMALVEAYLYGKACISLKIEQWEGQSDGTIPYRFSSRVQKIEGLPKLIAELERPRKQSAVGAGEFAFLRGSTGRLVAAFRQFM